jgi:Ca2+:H+ antiporter
LQQIDSTVHAIVVHETEQGAPVPSSQLQNVLVGGKQAEMLSKKADTPELAPVSAAPGKTEQEKPEVPANKSGLWIAIGLLAVVTAGVAWLSDILVGSIEPVTVALHWNPAFVGLVFVPLIGGLPEYFNTIGMTLDKRVDMVLSASAGSSIQLALLVAPILVLVSLFAPHRLDLVFSLIELAVLGLATFLFSEITKDGELVWLEGLLLILLYGIMAGTVFIFGA